jgi:hypothetical protein
MQEVLLNNGGWNTRNAADDLSATLHPRVQSTAITIGERYCTPDVPTPEEELIDERERPEPRESSTNGIARIL